MKKEETRMSIQGKIITGIIVIIGLFLLFNIFSAPINNNTPKKTNVNMLLLMDDDAVLGNLNAPITIIEFSDYECPFCIEFNKGTFKELKKKYIDTGIVKFISRDFPFNFHKFAQKSAEAAECAGEQDKYFEMNDKLFLLGIEGGVAEYKNYAKDLNLDLNKFNECLDSGKMATETSKDMIDGQINGVTGTPAFFINGKLLTGNQPIGVFNKIIKNSLKN